MSHTSTAFAAVTKEGVDPDITCDNTILYSEVNMYRPIALFGHATSHRDAVLTRIHDTQDRATPGILTAGQRDSGTHTLTPALSRSGRG